MFILLLAQLALCSGSPLLDLAAKPPLVDLSTNLSSTDPLLGLFLTSSDPFCLPPTPLPLSLVEPTFYVFTRSSNMQFSLFDAAEAASFVQPLDDYGFFAKNRQVVFIVHGYLNNVKTPWLIPLKDQLLAEEDSTVIIVDWRKGADFPEYALAASNTITTAFAVATVAQAVLNVDTFNGDLSQSYFYCIGHSLGAQVCGQAGRQAKTPQGLSLFDRVTGLDPAGPGFANCAHRSHIDKDSGDCVDVIHTDGTLDGHAVPLAHFGTILPWGHMDFYANGGHHQPGCSELRNDIGFCSHEKAHDFFMTTIGRREACLAFGLCSDSSQVPSSCGNSVTQQMGYYSSCHHSSQRKIEGLFNVEASGNEPFC